MGAVGRTIGDVVATMDDTVLRWAARPARETPVSDVVILDQTDGEALPGGALVLAVGVEPDGPGAAELVVRAAREGAAAVVVRWDGRPPRALAAAAEQAGVGLLTTPRGVTWSQLHALARTALADAGADGVPVGDLFSLADAIAASVGGPVTIEDPQWRVLAYSNLGQEIDEPRRHTILGRTPPPEWQERLEEAGVAQRLRRGEGVVHFSATNLAPRVVAPVRAGGELLGSIWLAVGEGGLAPDAEEQLLRAGELSAMHLLAHRAWEDLNRRARGASVRELLEGRGPSGRRGPPMPLSVVAFDAHAESRDAWPEAVERMLSIASLFAEAAHREAMCALVDDRLWALVPTPAGDAKARMTEFAERVAGRIADVLGVRVVGAVGPSVAALRDMPPARAATERALAVLARRGGEAGVVDVETLRAEAVLDELLELAAERPGLREGPVAGLDDGHLETLRAYLDASGDVASAAARLGVHPNTLRYRVRRIAELTGLDLGEPSERLVTELQLRLLERHVADDKP